MWLFYQASPLPPQAQTWPMCMNYALPHFYLHVLLCFSTFIPLSAFHVEWFGGSLDPFHLGSKATQFHVKFRMEINEQDT